MKLSDFRLPMSWANFLVGWVGALGLVFAIAFEYVATRLVGNSHGEKIQWLVALAITASWIYAIVEFLRGIIETMPMIGSLERRILLKFASSAYEGVALYALVIVVIAHVDGSQAFAPFAAVYLGGYPIVYLAKRALLRLTFSTSEIRDAARQWR
ncbi:hypothetical protein A1351_19430 [Methylosinus sp. R-45379]|uniref:hypothetical protein n=1 Tax=Methylosinus sp. R-45379 TaxID=980563 RepID=UPI0007C88935|nr:hypothetical protein [Methylosinus sp. R-45379]OAI23586.1 hypothetical protein A1351_19430 [Methylosinus sp. R-45379]